MGSAEITGRAVRFDLRGGRRWVTRDDFPGDDVVLQDERGSVLCEITRWPDGTWLDGTPAVAPDGRLCIVGKDRVALYTRAGELTDSFDLEAQVVPFQVVFAAEWIAAASSGEVSLIRTEDGSVRRFDVPVETKAHWTVGCSPTGDELWCVAADDRALHRFALPD